MADASQNPPTITIQTYEDLEKVAGDQYATLVTGNIEQVTNAVRAIRERLERENPGKVYFNEDVINQVLQAHPVLREEPFKNDRQIQQDRPFGSAAGGVGNLLAVAGGGLFADRAIELQTGIAEVQRERLGNQLQELVTQISKTEGLSPEEKVAMVRQKLSEFTSRSILEGQKEILKEELRKEKGIKPLTQEEQKDLDGQYDKINVSAEEEIKKQEAKERADVTKINSRNVGKEKPELTPDQKQLETVLDNFREIEKAMSGLKGTPQEIEKARVQLINQQQRLLESYVTYKQGRVFDTGKRILLGKSNGTRIVKRNLATRLNRQMKRDATEEARKKETLLAQKQREKDEEEKKDQSVPDIIRKVIQQEREIQTPGNLSASESIPEGIGEPIASETGGGGGGIGRMVRLARSLFGGGGTGGGAGAAGAVAGGGGAGGIIAIIIAVIIILLIIIILVMFVLGLPSSTSEPVTGVLCGDDMTQAAAANAENFRTQLERRYHVDVIVDPTLARDHTNVDVEKEIYSTICLLFGNNGGSDITQPATLNTFGRLAVGSDDERQRAQAQKIHYYVLPEDPKKSCGITKDTAAPTADIFWNINNPEECLSQPGVLSYFFAENLAETLILQQKHLHNGATTLLDNFVKNVLNTAGAMPSYICSNQPGSEGCFGDMVAEYLLWGKLFEGSGATETVAPTPTPTPGIPSQAGSFVPTLASILSPVGNYPKTWPLYYGFARVNLFDDQQFFTTPNNYTNDIAGLVTIVKEVETCETNQDNGKFAPPSPGCVKLLAIPAALKDALNATYPDFQCGQFIWAIQRFVLGWKDFPGDVGSVYDWYTMDPANHALPGYTFYCNPVDPQISCSRNKLDPDFLSNGDIIIYGKPSSGAQGSDPGHIAIVVQINRDASGSVSSFRVAEANYKVGVTWEIRTTTLTDNLGRGAYILGWWRYTKVGLNQPGGNLH